MNIAPLIPGRSLPMVLTPPDAPTATLDCLVDWALTHRPQIDQALYQSGVMLIRGFEIASPTDFKQAIAAIEPDLQNYVGGDSPRHNVIDKVYTSTEYPEQLEVLLHNELSYAGWSPDRVFFCCLVVARSGGETQIADGRQIYDALDPEVRARFEDKGITYLQHLWDRNGKPGAGKSWQETFETESKHSAENYLRKSDMQYEWTPLGIRTAATKPAVRVHPATGEKCWHNQADQWHRDMVSPKDSLTSSGLADVGTGIAQQEPTSGIETLGNHVCFGDGSPINTEDLYHVREISRSLEVIFPWKAADIMVIDNTLAMHGRKPFSGDRRVVVAMA